MRLTENNIRKLIKEALLTELFDSPHYPFNVTEMNVSDAHAESAPGRVFHQDVTYAFTTDPSPTGETGHQGFSYRVSFTLDMLADPGGMPWEPEQDEKDPNNYFWSIAFEAKEIGNSNADYDIMQTYQNDMQVLSTIASIVENFVTEVLPEIPYRDVKTFSFVGSPTHVFDDQKNHFVTVPADEGQTRRTRIYLAMLKRKLPQGSEIIPIPPGGYHSAGSEENIIFFRVP
jgi:hypothetical protein